MTPTTALVIDCTRFAWSVSPAICSIIRVARLTVIGFAFMPHTMIPNSLTYKGFMRGSLSPSAPACRGALHEHDRGGVCKRPTRRVPPAPDGSRAGVDPDRAHAPVAPRACGVDPV